METAFRLALALALALAASACGKGRETSTSDTEACQDGSCDSTDIGQAADFQSFMASECDGYGWAIDAHRCQTPDGQVYTVVEYATYPQYGSSEYWFEGETGEAVARLEWTDYDAYCCGTSSHYVHGTVPRNCEPIGELDCLSY